MWLAAERLFLISAWFFRFYSFILHMCIVSLVVNVCETTLASFDALSLGEIFTRRCAPSAVGRCNWHPAQQGQRTPTGLLALETTTHFQARDYDFNLINVNLSQGNINKHTKPTQPKQYNSHSPYWHGVEVIFAKRKGLIT